MSIKRWALLFFVGVVLTGLALAMALTYAYRVVAVPGWATEIVRIATLQFLPRLVRFELVVAAGLLCLALGFWRLSGSLTRPLMVHAPAAKGLAQLVAEHRFGPRRPALSVVAIGGGTGLSSLLRGLKRHDDIAITAIVTVADDGGSTGRIRTEFDIPAPGDIRNCLVALADDESLVGRLFQYRFDQESPALAGHSFGNLFITALTQVTGSFEHAVSETANVLAIRGRVLPSTLENVTLCAELVDNTEIRGESRIPDKHAPIKRVFLDPARPPAHEPALAAIHNADLVILGPGSLYTSVLPNLLVDGITQAIRWSRGKVVYVCNVATQPGETDHFDAADHVQAILNQLGPDVVDGVLVNSNPATAAAIGPDAPIEPVLPDRLDRLGGRFATITRDVISARNPLRHDPDKLATALLEFARGVAPAAARPMVIARPRPAGAPAPERRLVAAGSEDGTARQAAGTRR